ncbi:MAG TPA: hypothetical protein VGF86_07335 [Candidatus Tumulicola sp.]|jgi:hypothetical protein
MRSRLTGIAVAAALVCCVGVSAAPGGFVPRHLVYSFTFGTQSDLEVHSSGIDSGTSFGGSGSGMTDFTGGVGDQGTISVDLLSKQADGGLILKVSEQAQKTRSLPAATCVVYPTTGVICDPSVTVNPEEMAVIRLLAPTFVDPTRLDAKRHWKIENSSAQYSLTSDFTISGAAGASMTIDEVRIVKQQQPSISTTDVTTKIGYDFNRTLPTSVNEYSIERSQAGMGEYNTVKTQTVLTLQSDSSPPGR